MSDTGLPPKPANKEAAPEANSNEVEHINLRVSGNDHGEVLFKIRRNTPLKKLMDTYCVRQGKSPKSVRFLFDGNRLSENSTPAELDLNDGDTIDVMVEQLGGAC